MLLLSGVALYFQFVATTVYNRGLFHIIHKISVFKSLKNLKTYSFSSNLYFSQNLPVLWLLWIWPNKLLMKVVLAVKTTFRGEVREFNPPWNVRPVHKNVKKMHKTHFLRVLNVFYTPSPRQIRRYYILDKT